MSDAFVSSQGELFAENIPVAALAERFGTPLYIYSKATLERHYRAFDDALKAVPHQIFYAVKANSNLGVLGVLAQLGSGFDIVSEGELRRVLRAGGDPAKVVFSGVGKTESELRFACQQKIGCFNVESESELRRLNRIAAPLNWRAPIALRVNPDVDAKSHPYISTGLKQNKFGVDIASAERLYLEAANMKGIAISGIASHIGSQLLDVSPYLDALDRVLALMDRLQLQGLNFDHIDVGGGIGVRYRDEVPMSPAHWAAALLPKIEGRGLKLMTEPGRAIAANAGILVTKVEVIKQGEDRNFAVVDAAMNDLLRPSLYQAWMDIVPVVHNAAAASAVYDVVGPICETGDFLGKERELTIAEGDLLAVRTAGAYGFVMASNYNTRNRAAEVMVDVDRAVLVKERETFDDLIRGEKLL